MTEKTYQIILDNDEQPVSIYEPTIGYIPIDESNRDYQEYLASLEEDLV